MRKFVTTLGIGTVLVILALALWIWSRPDRGTTGRISTNFRWLGPDDRIAVDGVAAVAVADGKACVAKGDRLNHKLRASGGSPVQRRR